jgi:putative transposase
VAESGRRRDRGPHFPPEIILRGIRWYVASPLSTRHVEARMEERGVEVDHSTMNRGGLPYSPQLEEACHRRKRLGWLSWRLDETDIKVKGQGRSLYRGVDKQGQRMDFLLTEHRDTEAALRFLKKAIHRHGVPEKRTIDGSDANEAAMKSYKEASGTHISLRQGNYLNNIVEQAHRAVQRVTRPMLGLQSFDAAQDTLNGIELRHMLKKRPMGVEAGEESLPAADLCYALAASSPRDRGPCPCMVPCAQCATEPKLVQSRNSVGRACTSVNRIVAIRGASVHRRHRLP